MSYYLYLIPIVFFVLLFLFFKFITKRATMPHKDMLVLENKAQEEWAQKKEEIIKEFLSNPNKFGLVSDVTKESTIIGMISGKMPKGFKSKLITNLKDTVTSTKTEDMSEYYLVATDKGLHYTCFDGEKCLINEVFDYNYLTSLNVTKTTLQFNYKEEKIKFIIDNESGSLLLSGYPRFNVKEHQRGITSNHEYSNYFTREYLFPESDSLYSVEYMIHSKVIEHFIEGFKEKMEITF